MPRSAFVCDVTTAQLLDRFSSEAYLEIVATIKQDGGEHWQSLIRRKMAAFGAHLIAQVAQTEKGKRK